METNDKHIDFELITRHLAGETTGEESRRIDTWIQENPANRQLFDEYKNVWESLGKVKDAAGIDVRTEWEKLEGKIDAGDTGKSIRLSRLRKRSFSFYLTRIAAVLVIGLFISLTGIYIYRNSLFNTYSTNTGILLVELPDGSNVTLNNDSQLKAGKKFSEDKREVKLIGEGYFEVLPDPEKPFIVHTGEIDVAVLGTSFNVNAYKENEMVEVIVNTGQVAVTKEGAILEKVILKPGNKGTYNRSDQSLKLTMNQDPNYLSWKTKHFIFENHPLEEVIETINKVYHSNIQIIGDSLKQTRITTTFNNQSIDAILNVLKATLDIEVRSEEDKIELSRQ